MITFKNDFKSTIIMVLIMCCLIVLSSVYCGSKRLSGVERQRCTVNDRMAFGVEFVNGKPQSVYFMRNASTVSEFMFFSVWTSLINPLYHECMPFCMLTGHIFPYVLCVYFELDATRTPSFFAFVCDDDELFPCYVL